MIRNIPRVSSREEVYPLIDKFVDEGRSLLEVCEVIDYLFDKYMISSEDIHGMFTYAVDKIEDRNKNTKQS